MKRSGVGVPSEDGMSPGEQLRKIRDRAALLAAEQQRRWRELRLELAEADIVLLEPADLSKQDRDWLADYFRQVFPVVTPLAVDPAHPFPFIPNLGFSLALELAHAHGHETLKALIRMPHKIERFIRLPEMLGRKGHRFVALETLIALHTQQLFPAISCAGRACSASSATAISKSRKKRKISCCCSRRR